MNAIEIVEIIKNESPELLGKLTDKKASRIITLALSQIAKSVAELDQGVMRVRGLGAFHVRQIEREKEGQKTMVKVVKFSMQKPGAGRQGKRGENADGAAAADTGTTKPTRMAKK